MLVCLLANTQRCFWNNLSYWIITSSKSYTVVRFQPRNCRMAFGAINEKILFCFLFRFSSSFVSRINQKFIIRCESQPSTIWFRVQLYDFGVTELCNINQETILERLPQNTFSNSYYVHLCIHTRISLDK